MAKHLAALEENGENTYVTANPRKKWRNEAQYQSASVS